MVQRYTADQLLHLRSSQLVTKPSNLPPLDEWIGPSSEQVNQRKSQSSRAKADEVFAFDGSRRQPTYESKAATRTTSTAPEDIVLGPSRLAFSSAMPSRGAIKTGETTDRRRGTHKEGIGDSTTREADGLRDQYGRERLDKTNPDRERIREARTTTNAGRRGLRDDPDGWTNVRSGKSFGQEDLDRSSRRIGLRDNRDSLDRTTRGSDHHNTDRDVDRDSSRRNGLSRARAESSWLREGDAPAPRPRETRDSHRDREWRDRDVHHDRDWSRSTQIEKDPEWMDEPVSSEKQIAHTQEDFQRWKERMKAGNTQTTETTKEPPVATTATDSKSNKPSQRDSTPLILDSDLEDGFFRMWNQPKDQPKDSATQPQEASQKPVSRSGAAKASRFTSFFTPSEPTKAATAPPIIQEQKKPAIRPEEREDREGFQRIIQMLGGANISNTQPTFGHTQQPQLSSQERPQFSFQPGHMYLDGPIERDQPPEKNPPGLRASATKKDAEFLQGLLIGGNARNGHQSHEEDLLNSFQAPPQQHMQHQPNLHQNHPEDVSDYPVRAPLEGPSNHQTPSGHPTILRRPPPGLDQGPNGWIPSNAQQQQQPPPQQQQPTQHTHTLAPPPGLANAANRGLAGPFPPFHPPPGIFPGDMGMPPGFFMGPPPGYPPMGFPPGMVPPGAGQNHRPQNQAGYDIFGEGRGMPPER